MKRPIRPSGFASGDALAPRWVWDQRVHRWLGDRCTIVMLALPGLTESSRTKIESLLEECDIESYSVYLAYGSYDVIMRLWSTDVELERLLERLNQQYAYPQTEVFNVIDIDYSRWSSLVEPADESTVVRNLDDIADFNEDPDNTDLAERLRNQGLLHLHHAGAGLAGMETRTLRKDPDLVRVYVALLRQDPMHPVLNVTRIQALDRAIGPLSFLDMPSVYYGSGRMTDCVIKGFVDVRDVPHFHRHVIGLREKLQDFQMILRPMTLLTVRDGEVDRDVLRLNRPKRESNEVRRLAALLQPEAGDALSRIDPAFRDELAATFATVWPHVSASSFGRPLIDLIEGLVLRDEYRVNGSLSFLISLEARVRTALLGRVFPSITQGRSGDWRRLAQETLDSYADSLSDAAEAAAVRARAAGLSAPSSLGLGEADWCPPRPPSMFGTERCSSR